MGNRITEDPWYKELVRAIIKSNPKRLARISAGKGSKFDKMAAYAISEAINNVNIGTSSPEVREVITKKIIDSIETDTAWEHMGDTYCGRSTFYAYRKRFMKLIAINIGAIQDTTTKSVLRRTDTPGKGIE